MYFSFIKNKLPSFLNSQSFTILTELNSNTLMVKSSFSWTKVMAITQISTSTSWSREEKRVNDLMTFSRVCKQYFYFYLYGNFCHVTI